MLNMAVRPSRGGMLANIIGGMPPLPGAISGYGGGTFNIDGSPATPVQRGYDPQDDLPGSMPPIFARNGGGASPKRIEHPPIDPDRMIGDRGPPVSPTAAPTELPPANSPGDRPDYAALLRQSLGPRPELHGLRKVASILGPALMAASGNQAGANQMIESIRAPQDDYDRQSRALGMEAIKWRRDDDLAEQKRNEPRYFSGREDQVRFDPTSGTSERVYDAPQDFEDYAGTSGHDPGTPEYFQAVEDYVLKGDGPTVFKQDRDLEVLKNAQRISLEAERHRNRSALRGLPTYRDTHPAPPRASVPSTKTRPTATGPNGQRMEFDGKAWVPG